MSEKPRRTRLKILLVCITIGIVVAVAIIFHPMPAPPEGPMLLNMTLVP